MGGKSSVLMQFVGFWRIMASGYATVNGDVFSGFLNRKAVGRASVELIFDNSLGKAAGQYRAMRKFPPRFCG
jgi:hypothetical protein